MAPNGVEVSQAVNIPPLSIVSYSNGIEWSLDRSRLAVKEECAASFQDSYQTLPAIVRFLQTLHYVPYQGLGLNWFVSIDVDEPHRWLTERFLASGAWDNAYAKKMSMFPKFSIALDGAQLNIAFAEQIDVGDGASQSIVMDCNMHHQGPLSVPDLCTAINDWEMRQNSLIQALNTFCADEILGTQ